MLTPEKIIEVLKREHKPVTFGTLLFLVYGVEYTMHPKTQGQKKAKLIHELIILESSGEIEDTIRHPGAKTPEQKMQTARWQIKQ